MTSKRSMQYIAGAEIQAGDAVYLHENGKIYPINKGERKHWGKIVCPTHKLTPMIPISETKLGCEKCYGDKVFKEQVDRTYNKYCGDKDLWEKYSHIEVFYENESLGVMPIDAIYRDRPGNDGICVNHRRADGGYSNWRSLWRRRENKKYDVFTMTKRGGATEHYKFHLHKTV